jgi:hypothetical protein
VATSEAEGGLESEAETLAQQARNGRQSEGENLLSGSASSSDSDRG